jgi:hypothetical protein
VEVAEKVAVVEAAEKVEVAAVATVATIASATPNTLSIAHQPKKNSVLYTIVPSEIIRMLGMYRLAEVESVSTL